MAVTSFRLLPIELTLSRTFIYVTSGAIAVYGVLILASFGIRDTEYDIFSLIALSIAAVFITFLAGITLVKGIRSVVDRVYFGDWYNYRDEVQNLSRRLAASIIEREISVILTDELPDLLRIEKAILVVRDNDQHWIQVVQRDAPLVTEFAEAVQDLENLLRLEQKSTAFTVPQAHRLRIWGVEVVLRLIHADHTMGCLLLGRKDSHAPYSIRDFQLLHTLSSFAGLSIANLELHRELVERECRAVAADLAGGISHEINNALYPLKGQSQLIQHMLQAQPSIPNKEQFDASIKLISETTDKIQRISDNLNHLSEPIRPNKMSVSLNSIAEEAIEILSETAGRIKRFKSAQTSTPFELQRAFTDDLPKVEADPGQMSQIFINLILNAADAMEAEDHGILTIGSYRGSNGQTVCGFVEDTGVGIPLENIKEIIHPYFTTKAEGKGTGLGLAIVNSIIESHDGSLNIQSEPGNGTRIEFSIPLNSASSTLN